MFIYFLTVPTASKLAVIWPRNTNMVTQLAQVKVSDTVKSETKTQKVKQIQQRAAEQTKQKQTKSNRFSRGQQNKLNKNTLGQTDSAEDNKTN